MCKDFGFYLYKYVLIRYTLTINHCLLIIEFSSAYNLLNFKMDSKLEKKRFSKKKMINNKLVGGNVKIVRKALKIPTNYDTFAAKQMQIYKNSKAQEMFKERNKKYTCVEEGFQQKQQQQNDSELAEFSYPTIKSSISTMDFLDESTREMIINYEKQKTGQQQPSTSSYSSSFAGSSSGGHVFVGERPESVGVELFSNQMPIFTPPIFNPSIRPPPIPTSILQHCSGSAHQQFQQQQQKINQSAKIPSTSSAIMANEVVTEKEIKRETVDTEIQDEIPSFQSPPQSSDEKNLPPSTKTLAEFQEDEDKKRKQALLWGLCQEELTVTSAIGNATKRIENIRQKIEQQKKALTIEENNLEKLKAKRTELEQRRICLLKSVDM